MPLISVVIPVYGVYEWLPTCMDSLLKQTFLDFEAILVDDGSTDGSSELCDEYAKRDQRIRVIHKQNGGLSDARNTGTKAAVGRYITYVDSDDYVAPDYLQNLYHAIEQTGADIAVIRFDKVRSGGNARLVKKTGLNRIVCWSSQEACREMALGRNNSVIACAKLGRTELYRTFPFETGKFHEDLRHTYLLLHACKKVAMTDAVGYHYVRHGGSITCKKRVSPKQVMDYFEAIELCRAALKEWYPDIWQDIDALTAREYMSIYLMSRRVPDVPQEVVGIQRAVRVWFRQYGLNAVRNRSALHNVRLRALLMWLSPELYRRVYQIGIRFTGKKIA